MAHFVKLDNNNIVIDSIKVNDDSILENNLVSETKGIEFIKIITNDLSSIWKMTCKNTFKGVNKNGEPFRKNYAGIGFKYDEEKNAFIPPKPFNSWILNENTCWWEAPIQKPNDEKFYNWDEETISWKEIIL